MRIVQLTRKSPLSWLLGSLAGHALFLAVIGVALIIPTYLLVCFFRAMSTPYVFGQVALLALILPFLYYVFGIGLLLVSVIFYRILPLKSYTVDMVAREDWRMISFFLNHGLLNICQVFFLRFIRGTELMRLFYIGMGATIGAGTTINTDFISDCELIFIGKDSDIAANAVVNGHSAEKGIFRRGPVKIGNGVTIGQNAIIMPNVEIEDGVLIGANSLVLSGTTLKAGCTYLGVPARMVRKALT